ncbi:MAG: cadherin-like domain-containing protein [Phycisphaerae bacterium]|nr:cadherin-like domain-containing protein [Phycisphaerae bacterium]
MMREGVVVKKMSVVFSLLMCFVLSSICQGGNVTELTARDDHYLADPNVPNTFKVTLNDLDPESDNLTISQYDSVGAQGGTIAISGDASLIYTPVSGFYGYDYFSYTVTDGNGNEDAAFVRIDVNQQFNINAARSQILSGVSEIADASGPGWMVCYGPTAYSVGNYQGDNHSNPLIAIGTIGAGRVMALPDHQWLNMDSYGDTADTGNLYRNSIAWLTATTSKNVGILVLSSSAKTWLNSQGYNNVVNIGSYNGDLSDIDLIVGWPGNNFSDAYANALVDFARGGGALMLCDTGVGYDWWWGKDTPDMPTNKIFIHAGIGLTKESYGSTTPITAATGQTTAKDVLNVLKNPSAYSTTQKNIAGTVLGRIYLVLPEGHSLQAELDVEYYKLIESINPTPSTPVRNDFEKAMLTRECQVLLNTPVEETVAHRTAEAVWGQIPEYAQRVTKTLDFNVDKEGKDTRGNDSNIWLSTGLYAVPGEVVTVTTSSPITNKNMKVQISGDWNNISGRDSWSRMPFGTVREFEIESDTTLAANAFGGPVYITIPKDTVPGAFTVTIANAIEMPYFVLGENTNEQWVNEIRKRPAPYVEFHCDNVIFTCQKYQVIDIDDAEGLARFWQQGNYAQDDLAGLVGARTRPSRMYNMIQTAWGGGYAGYPIGAWNWNFGNLPSLEAGNCWGSYHELGHMHQSGYWTDGRTGEVTVNIFSMVGIEAACDSGKSAGGWGRMWDPASRVEEYQSTVAVGGFSQAGLGQRLAMFAQLRFAFGWEAFKATFQTYHDDIANNPSALPSNDQEEWDQFMIRFSRVVGYDLSPFFTSWDYGVSATAKNSLSDLPDWNMVELVAENFTTDVDTAVVLPNVIANDYSFTGSKTFVGFSQPANGTITYSGGSYRYTPNAGFDGKDSFFYTVKNNYNNMFTSNIDVLVGCSITRQVWNNINGSSVADLTSSPKYNEAPDSEEKLTSFKAPQNSGDNYGSRIIGFLKPRTSGDYTFWIASDDESQLYLSSNMNMNNIQLIAQVVGYTSADNFDSKPFQKSASIYLKAGRKYLIGALHKEGGGSDHLSVAWQGPDSPTRSIIDGEFLSPIKANQLPTFDDSVIVKVDALEGGSYAASLADDANDPDGIPLAFTVVGEAKWLTIDEDGNLGGIPGDEYVGLNEFTIKATDFADASIQATLRINVQNRFMGDKALEDFAGISSSWLNSDCGSCDGADLDGDNDVDVDDIAIMISNWMK